MMLVGVLFFGWLISSISDLLDVRPLHPQHCLANAPHRCCHICTMPIPQPALIAFCLHLIVICSTQRASVQARTAHELRQKLQEVRSLQVLRVHNCRSMFAKRFALRVLQVDVWLRSQRVPRRQAASIGAPPLMFWPSTTTQLSIRR